MIIKFNVDGSINEIIGSNIFQYSAGSNIIEMQIDKPQDSIVTISLVRADAVELSAKPCIPKTDEDTSAWVYTFGTSGSPDLIIAGDLDIAFTITRNGVSLNTEHYTGTVQTSYNNGFEPIDPDTATILLGLITNLQLDKVGRYDVSDVELLPAEIVYSIDGEKTPNNIYYNFTHNVIDFDGLEYEKNGYIIVSNFNDTQTEFFYTSDKEIFVRNIGESFTRSTLEELQTYTYDKATIDAKDTATLNSAIGYADTNFYNKTTSDGRFVHLTGNETINNTKTFTSVPLSDIDASANKHLVNRQTMTTYTYDKTTIDNKINELTQIYSFETEQNFLDWLDGTFDMKGGVLPADLKIGNKILIQEEGKQNYQVATVPVVSIADFKVIVEDNKDASEIRFDNVGTDLTSDNVEDVVKEVNDKTNAKSQISELPDLTILTTDWIADGDIYYYNYSNENFIDITKQALAFKLNISDADYLVLRNEDVIIFPNPDDVYIIDTWYEKIKVNKVPTLDLTFKVMLYSYTDEIVEAGTIPASSITYNNSISSLIATNVQNAIDELASVKVGGNTIYGGTIVDNLNTISKSGFYTCYGIATGVPLSNYSWAVIHINSNVGTINATQMAFDYVGVNMYKRTKTGSVWGGWQQIARWEDVVSLCLPKSGGTINGTLSVTGNINTNSDIQMQGDGDISLDGGTVKYVPTPTNSNDVANKEYVDSLSVYDKVIRTQTEFETLIASPTWLDAKSVAFVGDGGTLEFTSNLGVEIPENVFTIKGFNNAKLKVRGFGYATARDTDDLYSLDTLTVSVGGGGLGLDYAIENCINITNCKAINEGGYYSSPRIGFKNCSNLVNNMASAMNLSGTGYSYYNCSYGTNNRDLGSSTASTFGTMTKWSTETND